MEESYTRQIRDNFPYPIASSFVKLGTDECMDPGPLRLKYILTTSESIARFLGIVVLCECRKLMEDKGLTPSTPLSSKFEEKLLRPSWGTWIHFLREGLKWLYDNDGKPTMEGLYDFYFKRIPTESDSANALGQLVSIRNNLSHDKVKAMHTHEFKALCEETYLLLERVLENLSFLLDYELTFVSQIEVLKKRNKRADFRHSFKKIIGISEDFSGGRKKMESFFDSKSLILLDSETRKHINLDPLLVYEESAGKAPDLFYYNGMKNPGSAEYAPCKHGGGFKSSGSERAAEITEELQNLVNLFGGRQE